MTAIGLVGQNLHSCLSLHAGNNLNLSSPEMHDISPTLARNSGPAVPSLFFTTLRHRVYDGFGGCKAAVAEAQSHTGASCLLLGLCATFVSLGRRETYQKMKTAASA